MNTLYYIIFLLLLVVFYFVFTRRSKYILPVRPSDTKTTINNDDDNLVPINLRLTKNTEKEKQVIKEFKVNFKNNDNVIDTKIIKTDTNPVGPHKFDETVYIPKNSNNYDVYYINFIDDKEHLIGNYRLPNFTTDLDESVYYKVQERGFYDYDYTCDKQSDMFIFKNYDIDYDKKEVTYNLLNHKNDPLFESQYNCIDNSILPAPVQEGLTKEEYFDQWMRWQTSLKEAENRETTREPLTQTIHKVTRKFKEPLNTDTEIYTNDKIDCFVKVADFPPCTIDGDPAVLTRDTTYIVPSQNDGKACPTEDLNTKQCADCSYKVVYTGNTTQWQGTQYERKAIRNVERSWFDDQKVCSNFPLPEKWTLRTKEAPKIDDEILGKCAWSLEHSGEIGGSPGNWWHRVYPKRDIENDDDKKYCDTHFPLPLNYYGSKNVEGLPPDDVSYDCVYETTQNFPTCSIEGGQIERKIKINLKENGPDGKCIDYTTGEMISTEGKDEGDEITYTKECPDCSYSLQLVEKLPAEHTPPSKTTWKEYIDYYDSIGYNLSSILQKPVDVNDFFEKKSEYNNVSKFEHWKYYRYPFIQYFWVDDVVTECVVYGYAEPGERPSSTPKYFRGDNLWDWSKYYSRHDDLFATIRDKDKIEELRFNRLYMVNGNWVTVNGVSFSYLKRREIGVYKNKRNVEANDDICTNYPYDKNYVEYKALDTD